MLLQASPATLNPARERGLRRARARRAPCEPVEPTPMPAPISAEHALALLTRVRAGQVAGGGLTERGLYDVRAFKSAWAELGYLRRLAAVGKTGGTVITSMPQLVAGLARLHPAWRMDGDRFADRDRHHCAVRRRLHNLQAMGLLAWRVGIDADGEDARTELELRPAPDVSADELAAARTRLTRWRRRYGPALNTGSTTGIHNAAKHGRPLSSRQREQRGRERTLARAKRRRAEHLLNTDTAPRSAAPPTSENAYSTDHPVLDDHACGLRTRVTRTSASNHANNSAASNPANNSAMTIRGEVPAVPAVWDTETLLARVAARERERQPVLELIARQVSQRSQEVRGWGLERAWPASRLREAWVHARYGAWEAAEWGAGAAGRIDQDDHARLRRAVARYERNTQARPEGYPAAGLAALMHLGELAGAGGGPRTLRYAIGALDQLSRRMRAVHSSADAQRVQRSIRLAAARHQPDEPRTPLIFRLPGPRWPRWVKLTPNGAPLIIDGELQVHADWAPAAGSDAYRSVARDAHLLDQGWLPLNLDGRAAMRANASTYDPATGTHRTTPGPYPAPEQRSRTQTDRDVLELAHHSGLSRDEAERVAPAVREALLGEIRAKNARRVRAERADLQRRLTEHAYQSRTDGRDDDA